MGSTDGWFLVPGRHVIICPDCQQLVGQGAEVHHAKTCFKKKEAPNGRANGQASEWQVAHLRHEPGKW